jgi:hypothetical protein
MKKACLTAGLFSATYLFVVDRPSTDQTMLLIPLFNDADDFSRIIGHSQ